MKKTYWGILLASSVLAMGCSHTQHRISNSLKNTGHSMEVMGDDISIRHRIDQRFNQQKDFETSHIAVSSYDHNVLLVGQVRNQALKERASIIAKQTPQVRKVYNYLEIAGPTSALTRSSDAWITAKIKADILAQTGLPSRYFKVVTENGTVYLMGTVTRAQSKKAVNLARHTSGVQLVVTLFEQSN